MVEQGTSLLLPPRARVGMNRRPPSPQETLRYVEDAIEYYNLPLRIWWDGNDLEVRQDNLLVWRITFVRTECDCVMYVNHFIYLAEEIRNPTYWQILKALLVLSCSWLEYKMPPIVAKVVLRGSDAYLYGRFNDLEVSMPLLERGEIVASKGLWEIFVIECAKIYYYVTL